jgi:hypothetical protein
MAAKAPVPVEAFPGHPPLSGPWAPPTRAVMHPRCRNRSRSCGSGPWPRKRGFRLTRFHSIHRFRGHGPLLHGPWCTPAVGIGTLLWERPTAAKAPVPVEAFPGHPPLSGPLALPTCPHPSLPPRRLRPPAHLLQQVLELALEARADEPCPHERRHPEVGDHRCAEADA